MSIAFTPKVIFIVPYRAREQQKAFFSRHMTYVMEDFPREYYEIYFVHQLDTREFNRGAMKNAGFLAMRERYPADYKNITFVFNDVDCCPFTKNFLSYETTTGVVKHFYGFTHTLGGIVSITGGDFERVGGFPNFFGYGYEDNMLQQRVLAANITIDRSKFFPLYDPNIMSFRDGLIRHVNRTDYDIYMAKTNEGLHSFRSLKYRMEDEFIQVDSFDCGRTENLATKSDYDLRDGNAIFASRKTVGATNIGLMLGTRVNKNPKLRMKI